MKSTTLKIVKYIVFFLILIALVITVIVVWKKKGTTDSQIQNIEKKNELLNAQHIKDSISFIKVYDSLVKQSTIKEALIVNQTKYLQQIQQKYDKERVYVSSLDANNTLEFFTEQSTINPE